MELQVGSVVKSKAGRDKNRFLIITQIQGDYVFVADGKIRKLEAPKQKNIKHISKTNLLFQIEDTTTNKQVRKFLNELYLKEGRESI